MKMAGWLVVGILGVAAPGVANADVASPEREACSGKSEGDTCGSGGKCEKSQPTCRSQPDGGETCSSSLNCAGEDGPLGCNQSPSARFGPWAVALGVACAVSVLRRKRSRRP
jgi:hypothetical protein